MTKARDLADIISGGFTASDIPSLDASKITTGTLSTARYVDNDTVYTHPTSDGNKHIPSSGSSGQFLKYASAGTATWAADNDTVYTHPTTAGNKHIPSGGATDEVLTYSSSGTASWAAPAGGGKVLQIVQNHINTISSQSLSAATFANVSNLNASITPSSSSSKILVKIRWNGEITSTHDMVFGINRDSTAIGNAPSAGVRPFGLNTTAISYQGEDSSTPESAFYEYIDSPGDTSSHTYHATAKHEGNYTLYNNRTVSDSNNSSRPRVTSTITLIELESATILLNGA